jgi:hypothetical protein
MESTDPEGRHSKQKTNKTSEANLNATAKIKINELRRGSEGEHQEGFKTKAMSDTKGQKLKTMQDKNRHSILKIDEKDPHTVSDIDHGYEFAPLFPETAAICSEAGKAGVEVSRQKEKGDIGSIIDNLNSKLSNYIQTNNLEDTYRKFKLDFVQLRRNMLY